MWVTEIVERTIIETMEGIVIDGVPVVMRASRVDDEPQSPTERRKYPCMVIMASGGSRNTTESLFMRPMCTVTLMTSYKDDPKSSDLASLEDQFREILDKKLAVSTIPTAFNDIATAAGETNRFSGLVEIEGFPVERLENVQQIMTTMTFITCGA